MTMFFLLGIVQGNLESQMLQKPDHFNFLYIFFLAEEVEALLLDEIDKGKRLNPSCALIT